nr:TRAV6 [Sphenodon punctatus]
MGFWVTTATFLLAIATGVPGQDAVTQKDKFVSAKEGEPIQLNCSYTGSEYSLQWYKQRLDGQLQFIELLFQTGTKSGDHFSMTLDKEKKSTFLYLNSARLEDSAVYFCAPGGGGKFIFGSGTKLVVIPDLQKSEPSVYELESTNKSHPLSACLFTDYFPGNINVSATGSNLVGIESSVVVVEDQASYGAVLWQNANENLQCIANYDGEDIQAKKDIADSCSGTQMSFQTDERLNLLSLTVLGLRVIFFKSVAVNLLLTFRLWSR